jgi:hypothetical protein
LLLHKFASRILKFFAMEHSYKPNFTETIDEVNYEQPPTNQTTNATQMERTTSYAINNQSSYANLTVRRRRIQRQLRHETTINVNAYILNHIRRLPVQRTNDQFAGQIFNGSTFH